MMMQSLIRQCLLFRKPFLLGGLCIFVMAGFLRAENGADTVTTAEVMDVEAWLQGDSNLRDQVLGTWTGTSAAQVLKIQALPIADNTVLVSLEERMVPGFLTRIEGTPYLVVGDLASSELELMPRIFQIRDAESDNEAELLEWVENGSRVAFVSPQALEQWLEQHSEPAEWASFRKNS